MLDGNFVLSWVSISVEDDWRQDVVHETKSEPQLSWQRKTFKDDQIGTAIPL